MQKRQDIGIDETDLLDIISLTQKNEKIEKVILFGSRAKGSFSPGSDIDLAISGSDLALHDILDLSVELEALNLPFKFDIVILERIKEPALLEHIARVGIVLFERNNDG